jgi:hypothetical protein
MKLLMLLSFASIVVMGVCAAAECNSETMANINELVGVPAEGQCASGYQNFLPLLRVQQEKHYCSFLRKYTKQIGSREAVIGCYNGPTWSAIPPGSPPPAWLYVTADYVCSKEKDILTVITAGAFTGTRADCLAYWGAEASANDVIRVKCLDATVCLKTTSATRKIGLTFFADNITKLKCAQRPASPAPVMP